MPDGQDRDCTVTIFWFGPPGTCPPFFEYCGGLIGVNYCGLALPPVAPAQPGSA